MEEIVSRYSDFSLSVPLEHYRFNRGHGDVVRWHEEGSSGKVTACVPPPYVGHTFADCTCPLPPFLVRDLAQRGIRHRAIRESTLSVRRRDARRYFAAAISHALFIYN